MSYCKRWSPYLVAAMLGAFLVTVYFHKNVSVPVIDVHEHIQSMAKAELLLQAKREKHIDKIVLVPSPHETITLNGASSFTRYRENTDVILEIAKKYPDDFIPFCTVSPLDDDILAYFQECVQRGGKGLKLYTGHSYYHAIFKTTLDTEKMLPIYAYAEKQHLPILFHVNINKFRTELENILTQFPNLTVAVPHFMISTRRLFLLEELFHTYPNLYTDISFGATTFFASGISRISIFADQFKTFFNRYADRILFATDMVMTNVAFKNQHYMEQTYTCYRDLLEKTHFSCPRIQQYYKVEAERRTQSYDRCTPKEEPSCQKKKQHMAFWQTRYEQSRSLNGLGLSREILQKIYVDNPIRFLSGNN